MKRYPPKNLARPIDRAAAPLSPAELAENEKRVRGELCAREINALLDKFGCRFSPVMVIADGKIEMQINIVSR